MARIRRNPQRPEDSKQKAANRTSATRQTRRGPQRGPRPRRGLGLLIGPTTGGPDVQLEPRRSKA